MWAVSLGLIIGLSLGLTGAGGGILAVPALMFGLGLTLPQAAPIALIAVGAAALVGVLQALRDGKVRYKAAAVMAVAGGITSPLGLWATHFADPYWLNICFAVVLFLVALRMWHQARKQQSLPMNDTGPLPAKVCVLSPTSGKFIWTLATAITLAGIGAVAGFFTGLLGIGGGFIIVPALAYFSNAKMDNIVPTSLMVIALVSATTVVSAFSHGLAITAPQWLFISCTMLGMVGGRLIAPRIPAPLWQRLFAVVCTIVAVVLLAR